MADDSDRVAASAALDQADAHSGDAHQSDYAGTMALIGIGRALLEVGAAIREQNELIAPAFENCVDDDGFRGIQTVDTTGDRL